MSVLLEKARKDYDVVKTMNSVNDELYLDICCYHIQQAIEKILKCSIEMRGKRFSIGHNISKTYDEYCLAGWDKLRDLELMAGTITDWEASSRYKESFYATLNQLQEAIQLYEILEKRLMDFIQSETTGSDLKESKAFE